MKMLIACILALTGPLGAQNLFDNSTMDTAGGWKGSKKFVKEGDDVVGKKPAKEEAGSSDKPNRCLQVTAKPKDKVSFNQEVDSKDVTDLILKFRYRTKDYVGRGMSIQGIRQTGNFTYMDYTLVADGQWHEITWKFTQVQDSRKIDFSIAVLEGTGDVYFDDITVEAKK